MMDDKLNRDDLGYPELLEDMAAAVGELLCDKLPALSHDDAAEVGIALAEHLRRHWGGQSFYVPQGSQYRASLKHLEIWRDFNGRNHRQLARAHGVSLQQVYVVIRRMRQKLRDKSQGQLF